jgi:hypothetical protein
MTDVFNPLDAQAKEISRAFRKLEECMVEALSPKSCITCGNFDEPNELCMIAKQRPPARTIATGCKVWTQLIPF